MRVWPGCNSPMGSRRSNPAEARFGPRHVPAVSRWKTRRTLAVDLVCHCKVPAQQGGVGLVAQRHPGAMNHPDA